MSAYSQFNGAVAPTRRLFLFSTTYTPTVNTVATIYVVGGGGGGGGFNSNYGGGSAGGGACAVGIAIPLSSSVTYTVTVGAGGSRGYSQRFIGAYGGGGTGGTSSFSGTGITTLSATGGTGGSNGTNGSGGTATGGTQNWRGGAGGAAGGNSPGYVYGTRSGASGFYGDLNNATYWQFPFDSFAAGAVPGTGSGTYPGFQMGGLTAAATIVTSNVGWSYANDGGFGAGGGGIYNNSYNQYGWAGAGGAGFVLIEAARL